MFSKIIAVALYHRSESRVPLVTDLASIYRHFVFKAEASLRLMP